MSITPNLGLQDVPANSLQPSVPINAALRVFDALVQPAVQTTISTPPTTTVPADAGKRWIIGASPSGAWAGRSGAIALCVGADLWQYFIPSEGWTAYDRGDDVWRDYDGTAWRQRNAAVGVEFSGLIVGLVMEWVSGTSLRVTSGAAHIQGIGKVLAVTSAVTKAGLSLSNDTTYHVYLYVNAGAADVEVVTTAPDTAYSGKARSKTGDTSRRYLGSVRTNGSAAIREFLHDGDCIRYQENTTISPYRALGGGTATVWTAIPLSAIVPMTAKAVMVGAQTVGGTVGTDISSKAAGAGFFTTLNPSQYAPTTWPIDATQNLYYKAQAVSSGPLYVDVWGYTFER